MDFVEEVSLKFLTQKLDISFTDDVICDDAIKKVIEIIKDEENDAINEEI